MNKPKYTKIKQLRLEKQLSLKEVEEMSGGLISFGMLAKYEKEDKLLWNAKYAVVKKLAEIYNLKPTELFYEEEIEINMKNKSGVKYINKKHINRKDSLQKYLTEFVDNNKDNKHTTLFISTLQLKQILAIDEDTKTYQTKGYIVYKIINPVVENINKNNTDIILSKSTLKEEGIEFHLNRKEDK